MTRWRRELGAASICIGALMAASVLLRTGVLDGIGDYSDIVHLYRRDGLADHPVPYVDYPLEYPVLIGAFEWVVGFVRWSDGVYFAASAAVLSVLAMATMRFLDELPAVNPWLLAATPGVVFWGVQNWDFFGIGLLVAALVLFERERDGSGAAVLALAVWVKLFPLVVLPVVLAIRAAQGRWRSAGVIAASFALVTVVVNAPVAIDEIGADGVELRAGWTYFFEFSHDRSATATLWSAAEVGVSDANRWSGVLLTVGIGALVIAVRRCARRGNDVLLPATAVALLWFFATNKVYSVQYGLWIVLALALAGLPLRAMVAFAAIDILLFVTLWGGLPWLGEPWPGDTLSGLRQIATAGLALWVAVRMTEGPRQPALART